LRALQRAQHAHHLVCQNGRHLVLPPAFA
jgi:hypothetical protein